MNGRTRVYNTIKGLPTDRQPIYGWLSANLREEISERFGSVEAFEDLYEFDAAHLFTGPTPYNGEVIDKLRAENDELTPDLLLEADFFNDPDDDTAYEALRSGLSHHRQRERFCYVQTPGFFEAFNDIFGIENHLLYLLLYPDEIKELYRRQAEWTIRFADRCIAHGVDCIHISDDWGAQKDLLFSPQIWKDMIYPNMKRVIDHVHGKNCLVSLHSDGCIAKVADGIAELGIDMVHPWQESAGMGYDLYLEKYADKFAIMGGICIQTALGILPRDALEAEIRRVFSQLSGKRWLCCTTHFVQSHCTMDDLVFAYDLIRELSKTE